MRDLDADLQSLASSPKRDLDADLQSLVSSFKRDLDADVNALDADVNALDKYTPTGDSVFRGQNKPIVWPGQTEENINEGYNQTMPERTYSDAFGIGQLPEQQNPEFNFNPGNWNIVGPLIRQGAAFLGDRAQEGMQAVRQIPRDIPPEYRTDDNRFIAEQYDNLNPAMKFLSQVGATAGEYGGGIGSFTASLPDKFINPGRLPGGDPNESSGYTQGKPGTTEGATDEMLSGLKDMFLNAPPQVYDQVRKLGILRDILPKQMPGTDLLAKLSGKEPLQYTDDAIRAMYESAGVDPAFAMQIALGGVKGGLKLKDVIKVKKPDVNHYSGDFMLPDAQDKLKMKIKENRNSLPESVKPLPELIKNVREEKEDFKKKLATGGVLSALAFSRKKSGDYVNNIRDSVRKAKIARSTKEGIDLMIQHDEMIRNKESLSQLLKQIVNDIVPDKKRQMLMVHAYENKMKGSYWDNLNKIEKGVVRLLAQEKSRLNSFIKENKIVDLLPEDKFNHVFHWWKNPNTGEPFKDKYSKLSKSLPQEEQRVIETYESGIKAGYEPASTNLGELIGKNWESVMRAHQARSMFRGLYDITGDPNVKIKIRGRERRIGMVEKWTDLVNQGLTEDYIRMDHWALDKPYVFKGKNGQTVMLKGATGVHKDLYPFVDAYLNSPTYGTLSKLNFVAKSLKLGVSLFHVNALAVQEFTLGRMPYKNIYRGLQLKKELGWETRLLHQQGLELFKGYEDTGAQNKFFEGLTKAQRIGNTITKPIEWTRNFIFNVVQPGMKTSFAFDKFNKLLPKYLKGTGWTPEMVAEAYMKGDPIPKEAKTCAREVVQKADGYFSGEHYKRSLLETNRFMVRAYFSPEARKAWQSVMLSPTWQREHLLVGKNVLSSFLPDKLVKKMKLEVKHPAMQAEYRRYAYRAIAIVGAVDMWNYLSTQQMDGKGKHLWQNPSGKGFAVRSWWDEPDYTITDKNGKKKTIKGGPAYIRPLKSIFEIAETAVKPIDKFSYKLSPWVSTLADIIFNINGYRNGSPVDVGGKIIRDVTVPITGEQLIQWTQKKKSGKAVLFPFFGMPVSKGGKTEEEKQKSKKSIWGQ